MTMTEHETTIDAPPGQPVLVISREFDAPASAVFAAHVDADLYMQWVGPRDIDSTVEAWDARTGGEWRYVSRRGDEEYRFYGSFHEVRDGSRIVQTFTWDGAPDGVSLETLTFEDLPGGRCRIVGTSLVDSVETRDQILVSGMQEGVIAGYEKLDELLAARA